MEVRKSSAWTKSLNTMIHTVVIFTIFLAITVIYGFLPAVAFAFCLDINDEPMETKVQSAPPNIMFVLDNSGSMDWEFMTQENDGLYGGKYYLYPDSSYIDGNDRAYGSGHELTSSKRQQWRSQWQGYNRIYYTPDTTFSPWPEMPEADLKTPWSNPYNCSSGDSRFNLNDTYYTVEGGSGIEVIVDNTDPGFLLNNAAAWTSMTNSYPHYGADYYFTNNNNDAMDDWVRWTPVLPEPGTYTVSVWWTSNNSRDTTVTYTISHNGGFSTSGGNNQQLDAGQWNSIGDYQFSGDGTEYVQLDPDMAGDSHYSADAVRFSIPTDIITVSNAHYFMIDDLDNDGEWDSGEAVYLINFMDTDSDGQLDSRDYYLFDDKDGDNSVDNGELILKTIGDVPDSVRASVFDEDGNFVRFKTDLEDLQNFANWFSYYRKRELTVKAAVAGSIYNLEWVYAGYYSINSGLRQPVLPIEVETDSIIIDNKDSRYEETGGGWRESSASDEYAGSSRYTNDSGDYATWSPDIPSAGQYKVYAWWDYWNTRDTNAKYTIHDTAGDHVIRKNQQENASTWVELGTFDFAAGTGGYVRVTRDGSSTQSSTSSDAVKFEPVVGGVEVDSTNTLLDLLYEMDSSGNTPLRTAVNNVGHYFDQDDGNDGNLGVSPYADADDGGSCQQSFTIVMTDGFWNGSSPGVGNQDANTANNFDGSPYADSYSDTLADVAMKYYKEDLSDTLSNVVSTNSCDQANHQHMVTYGVSFGVTGTLNPDDYHACLLEGAMPTWPDPTAGDQEKIDDLWHAAVNGRGLFFSASDPQELVDSLVDMMSNIASRISSGASVSVNGEELNSGTVLFQANYVSGSWIGDVTAYPVDPDSGEILKDASNIKWKASDELQKKSPDDRHIITFSPDPDGNPATLDGVGIPFKYASLTSAQQLELNSDSRIVDYIRGEEVDGFRTRSRKLGDIVHSAPLLVGETIYAGGNDGMLHAFNANSGEERFAYIPDLVMDGFHNGAAPDKSFYKAGYEHRFFVDLSPAFQKNVLLDRNGDGVDDKTILLVGGLGKGGKGYYCLDITDADTIGDSTAESSLTGMALWEYPIATDDDMGYTYSSPVIVRVNADLNGDSLSNDWGVIFGNGYDSVNGHGVLYILDVRGNLIKKIDTQAGSCNGLSSPAAIDVNNDLSADYVYAGDLKGNLWKFDLTASDKDNWTVAFNDGNPVTSSPMPLFSAPGQPITSKPDVTFHCAMGEEPDCDEDGLGDISGYMIIFGTGKYLDETDRTNTDTQSIFGIWDFGDDDDDSEYLGTFSRTGAKQLSNMADTVTLLHQTEVNNQILGGNYLRTLSAETPDWTSECDVTTGQKPNPIRNAGWYFDLPIAGERIIKNVFIREGRIIYLTFTPNTSPCSGGGDSIIHEADVCDGGRLDEQAFDINNDKKIDDNDLVDIGLKDPDGNPILVPPTGIGRPGLLHFPIILRLPDREMKVFSSSAGTTETLFETLEKRGIYYWIER